MRLNSLRPDRFSPIEEATVHATVTYKGVARNVLVPHKKVFVTVDTGDRHRLPRFRRDRPTLERRAGVWLRDFTASASRPGLSITSYLAGLAQTH